MAQQFDYPKTDTDLRKTSDELYQSAKSAFDEGKRPTFKGLIEIMSAEATIVTAIHNIKSNKGSYTPGTDKRNMKYYYNVPACQDTKLKNLSYILLPFLSAYAAIRYC